MSMILSSNMNRSVQGADGNGTQKRDATPPKYSISGTLALWTQNREAVQPQQLLPLLPEAISRVKHARADERPQHLAIAEQCMGVFLDAEAVFADTPLKNCHKTMLNAFVNSYNDVGAISDEHRPILVAKGYLQPSNA